MTDQSQNQPVVNLNTAKAEILQINVPSFEQWPAVVLWNNRAFLLRPNKSRGSQEASYYEASSYTIPVTPVDAKSLQGKENPLK